MDNRFIKYILCSIFITFTLLLSGCTSNTTKPFAKDNVTLNKALDIVDIAPLHDINFSTLEIYANPNDPKTPYVNIVDFLERMRGDLNYLNISNKNNLTISAFFSIPPEYQDYYGGSTYIFKMTIDQEKNTITLNDVDFLNNIAYPPEIENKTDLYVNKFEITDHPVEKTFNLGEYGFDILYNMGEYYIPLFLANLFFSGPYLDAYQMNDKLIIFDIYTEIPTLVNEFQTNNEITVSDISTHTKNLLAFYFDHFYGLKEYNQVSSFKELLNNYDFDGAENFSAIHAELESFLDSQNDLHTSIVTTGYLDQSFEHSRGESTKAVNYYNAYLKNSCSRNDPEVEYQAYGNDFVITVNGFSLESKELLADAFEHAKYYENIIIDVGCNPGGTLLGAMELVKYMTDKEIPIAYINPLTDIKVTEYYLSRNVSSIKKNYYVFTTAATYSAANLFVSIVKDMDLAVVFGEHTGGGACSIDYLVLPDGSLLSTSSNMGLLNKNGEMIEDGIPVDVTFNYPIDYDTVVDEIEELLGN